MCLHTSIAAPLKVCGVLKLRCESTLSRNTTMTKASWTLTVYTNIFDICALMKLKRSNKQFCSAVPPRLYTFAILKRTYIQKNSFIITAAKLHKYNLHLMFGIANTQRSQRDGGFWIVFMHRITLHIYESTQTHSSSFREHKIKYFTKATPLRRLWASGVCLLTESKVLN